MRDGMLEAIVEARDCTPAQATIGLCNAGLWALDGKHLFDLLEQINTDNAKGEYYLTDVVALARGRRAARAAPWRRRPTSSPASIRAPNWPRPRRWCRPGCAPPRWRPA